MSELMLKVHRCRFYLPEVTSINCMSYNEDNQKLALIRRRIRKYKTSQSDTQSVVQIWNMKRKTLFIEQTIYDDSDNPSLLEGLLWAPNSRLFSCGLNAQINEYDLTNNRIKRSYSLRSGPVWCMALDLTKSLIAVGTEEGDICVYRLEEDCLEFNKMFDRNDSRILCLKWYKPEDNSSQLIVTGSIDYIKIWNYQTGRCVDHIQVGNNGVIVWCLTVLKDFTIISGDSNGKTIFWNGNTTTLIISYGNHRADVLSICVNSDETNVYSSGVDPDILIFERYSNDNFKSWIQSGIRKLHTHDVRTLTTIDPNWLISGGIDSYLTLSCYPPNLQLRYLTDYSSSVTIIKDFVFFQYETFVQIWKLGKSEDDLPQTNEDIQMLSLSECAKKLADIKSKKPIIAGSFNEIWVVYSNSKNIKIKSWSLTEIKDVPVLCEPIPGATQISFCGLNFVAIVSGTAVYVLKLDNFGAILQTRFDFEHRIYSITTSNQYLVVSTTDPKNTIRVYDTKKWTQSLSFANHLLFTTFKISEFSTKGDIWMAFPDYSLICYQIKTKKFIKSIEIKECIPPEMYQQMDEYWSIKQLSFADNCVLFSDDNHLYKYNKRTDQINISQHYRHIIKLGNSNQNEMSIVEVTPEMHTNFLPNSLTKKKFGV